MRIWRAMKIFYEMLTDREFTSAGTCDQNLFANQVNSKAVSR